MSLNIQSITRIPAPGESQEYIDLLNIDGDRHMYDVGVWKKRTCPEVGVFHIEDKIAARNPIEAMRLACARYPDHISIQIAKQ